MRPATLQSIVRGLVSSAALTLFFSAAPALAEGPLTLAVHPYLASTEIVKRFTPLAQRLGAGLGRKIVVKVSRDYREHIDLAGSDNYDLAYMGPVSYVRMVDAYGPKRILARLEVDGKPSFRGAVIVSAASRLHTLEDLKGKSFAFGDPDSTMSHMAPRYMLSQAGIGMDALSRYAFVGNHHNVALSVLMGDYDAGAVKEEVFYKYRPKGLRVIAWSPDVPEHLFIAGGGVAPDLARRIRIIMTGLKNAEGGRAAMRSIKETVTALAPADDSDYDGLRGILREYSQLIAGK